VRAVNWGGYRGTGGELDGSRSPLPSRDGNPNTRLYDWELDRPHMLRVFPSPEGRGWRATVDGVVIRDLYGPGDTLVDPIVWSEVFADCDDPPVVVRWSDLQAVTVSGVEVGAATVTVTYQAYADGGCDNTTIDVDDVGICQRTATPRTLAHGSLLRVPGGPAPLR
jgi:hypothetical protein